MANIAPRKILDNILFSAKGINTDALHENLARLPFIEELGSKLLVFEDIPYHVDYAQLAHNVRELARLIAAGRSITGRDVVALPSIIVRAPREDEKGVKIVNPPHALYSAELIWDSFHWPTANIMGGAVLIIGDTGAGKTYSMVNSYEVDIFVRYSEPQEQADMAHNVVPARSLFEAVSIVMALGVLGAQTAIDSLRSLVYTLRGNAVAGGMSGSMYDVTTQLNNMFAEVGIVSLLALNPLASAKKDRDGDVDASATEDLVRKLASGVAGAIHLHDNGKVKSQTYRLTNGRFSSGREAPKGAIPLQNPSPLTPSRAPKGYERGDFTALSMRALEDSVAHDQMANALGPVLPEGEDSPRPSSIFVL